MVFIALCGMDVDLSRKIASGVHLFIHSEGCILAITKVIGGISEIYTMRNTFFVVATSIYVLTFRGMANRRAGVLAERKLAFGGNFGVAQHCKCYKLIVLACFRIG